MTGKPFFYFAYGVAVSEVIVDTLTGEHRLLAVDVLHDVGTSLNPAIDLGQVEGAFVQGYGWLTRSRTGTRRSGPQSKGKHEALPVELLGHQGLRLQGAMLRQ